MQVKGYSLEEGLLIYCGSRFREMVFLYSKLDTAGAEHTEYPTNHSKKNRELGSMIRQQLGLSGER